MDNIMSNHSGKLTLKVETVKYNEDKEYLKGVLHHLTDDDFNGNNGQEYFQEDNNGNLRSRLDISFEKNWNDASVTPTQLIERVLSNNYNDNCYSQFSVNTTVIGDCKQIVISLAYVE